VGDAWALCRAILCADRGQCRAVTDEQ